MFAQDYPESYFLDECVTYGALMPDFLKTALEVGRPHT